jgi:alpha-L-fucosidase
VGKGWDHEGDFSTPEQEIPPDGIGRDWESCMTMNGTWGYSIADTNWKSTETLIKNLIDCASKGGNYLLNVGPDAHGVIPEASAARLQKIGTWLEKNGESIYGTSASIFEEKFSWGRVTTKSQRIYLHVFARPQNGYIDIPLLGNQVNGAYSLKSGEEINYVINGNRMHISVPVFEPENNSVFVIAVDVNGEPQKKQMADNENISPHSPEKLVLSSIEPAGSKTFNSSKVFVESRNLAGFFSNINANSKESTIRIFNAMGRQIHCFDTRGWLNASKTITSGTYLFALEYENANGRQVFSGKMSFIN